MVILNLRLQVNGFVKENIKYSIINVLLIDHYCSVFCVRFFFLFPHMPQEGIYTSIILLKLNDFIDLLQDVKDLTWLFNDLQRSDLFVKQRQFFDDLYFCFLFHFVK